MQMAADRTLWLHVRKENGPITMEAAELPFRRPTTVNYLGSRWGVISGSGEPDEQ